MRDLVAARSNSHAVVAFQRQHHNSAYGGQAREDEAILRCGFSSPAIHRFVRPDRPRLIGPRRISSCALEAYRLNVSMPLLLSGHFEKGALDDDARVHIFPQRDKQLARQRDDRRLALASALARIVFAEPTRQRRLRLMARP